MEPYIQIRIYTQIKILFLFLYKIFISSCVFDRREKYVHVEISDEMDLHVAAYVSNRAKDLTLDVSIINVCKYIYFNLRSST